MAGTNVNLVEIESDRENSFLATHARSLPGGNALLFFVTRPEAVHYI